jgi:hypothetical protein
MGFDKLEVVRKLLAKAERAATEEEAASYTDKAMQLSARHGIDAALLAAADPTGDRPDRRRIAVDDPYSAGKARLLGWVASALGCRAVLHQRRGGRVEAVSLVGFAADQDRVELLYTSLLLQAAHELARQRPVVAGESVAAYRRSWLHGFAVRVHERLVEAERNATQDATRAAAQGGTGSAPAGAPVAVVLAERAAQVVAAFAAEFPAAERARGRALSGSGFGLGAAAGERADLGGARVAAARRRQIGATVVGS